MALFCPPEAWRHLYRSHNPPTDLEAGGSQTYNTLLEPVRCFPEDEEVGPSLAKSWTISPDGLTWTLKLRENVKWHNLPPVNGRSFTSADVAWMVDWQIAKGALRRFWDQAEHSEPDLYTMVFRLKQPDPDFVHKLANSANKMQPREIFEQDGDFKKRAVGTGAFMVKDFKVGSHIYQARNPDYYEMGADGKALPYLDEYDQPGFAEVTAELAAMRAGLIDHPGVFGFRPDQAAFLTQCCPALQHYQMIAPIHGAVWFDPRVSPWNDVRVRRAVLKAVDRDALIVSLQGGVAHSGFAPAYYTNVAWPEEKLKEKFKYDPEGAKRLLAESGHNFAGRTFDMITTGQYAQEAEVVQHLLAKVGINTAVKVAPDRAWGTTLEKGGWEIGWGVVGGGSAVSPAFQLCDIVQTSSSGVYSRFSDPEVDRLCAAQGKEIDYTKRQHVWNQIQDRLYEVVPFVPTVSTVYDMFLSCRVKNYKRVHLGRNPSGAVQAWIDQTGC